MFLLDLLSLINFLNPFSKLTLFNLELVISGIINSFSKIFKILAYLTFMKFLAINSVKKLSLYIINCGIFLLAISKLAVPEQTKAFEQFE